MILDTVQNFSKYLTLDAKVSIGLYAISNDSLKGKEPGRYELGEGVYALVQQYKTKPEGEGNWETHRKYIDIQYVETGNEEIGYTPVELLQPKTEYNIQNDFQIHFGKGNFIDMRQGMFAIFYPWDAHMPGIGENPQPVGKIVIKVPYEG
jgi:YhcH/YjgK/YiaL family protein